MYSSIGWSPQNPKPHSWEKRNETFKRCLPATLNIEKGNIKSKFCQFDKAIANGRACCNILLRSDEVD